MTSPQDKILKMVADDRITPEDANELFGAIGYRSKFKWRYLINPFERIPDILGIFIAFLIIILSGFVSVLLRLRFDGALDVHVSFGPVSVGQAVVDQCVAWLGLALVFWIISHIFAKEGRFIDFLVTVGISRVAMLFLGIVVALLFPDPNVLVRVATSMPYHPKVILLALAGMIFLVWFFTWLFQGFKTASGLTKVPLVSAFVIAIIAAEVMSKAVLYAAPVNNDSSVEEPSSVQYILPGETHEDRAKAFLQLLESGSFDKAWSSFNPKMAQALSATHLKRTYGSIKWEIGKFVDIEEVQQVKQKGLVVVDLFSKFEKKRCVVRVVFDQNERVAGLWFNAAKSTQSKNSGKTNHK